MTTRRFLHLMAAAILLAVSSTLGGARASAQCTCSNTVTMDPSAPCCVLAQDIMVECDDGTIHPFDPGAPPGTFYCRPSVNPSPCPCPNFTRGVWINASGTSVNIPVGRTRDIRYGGDCCLRITVTVIPSTGCIDINISAAPLC